MSTADPLLQLELMIAGENKGTWHTNANNVFTQIAEAIALRTTLTFSNADITLTDTTKASNQSRSGVLVLAGTLSAAVNAIIPNRSKTYFVTVTATVGAYSVSIKTSGGAAVTLSSGLTYLVVCDGANGVTAFVQAPGVFVLTNGGQKTSGFTAAVNNRYRCAFSASGTITLPASPSNDDVIVLALTGQGIIYTLNPNGNKINGRTSNLPVDSNQTMILTYDTTNGWA